MYLISGTVVGRAVERGIRDLVVRNGDVEPIAKRLQRVLAHLLLLVGDVLPLARFPHPVALHGLGEDDGRLAGVLDRLGIGGVDLVRIVAAAVQAPDVLVGQVRDHLPELRVLPEEVLPGVGPALGLEVLVLAVDRLLHALAQQPLGVEVQQRVPVRAPDHLQHVPPRPAERRLQLLDDLAVAAHRAVEALEVAVDDEDEVVELLTRGQGDRAERLGLVHLPVAHERPHLAPRGVEQPPVVQVLHEPGLVDGHDRAEPHRHGGGTARSRA